MRAKIIVALILLASAGCKRKDPDASVEHKACGAAITAPGTFEEKLALKDLEELRLLGPDGARFSLFCIPKESTAPSTMRDQAKWFMEAMIEDVEAEDIGYVPTSSIDNHAVLALGATLAKQEILLVATERARIFYFLEYSAPRTVWTAHENIRSELLQSFRLIDPTLDRGEVRWWTPEISEDRRTLSDARAVFETRVPKGRPKKGFDGTAAPTPPKEIFELIDIPGPAGRLSTYLTPDPKDGKKHPAVIWAHGGFGGIDRWFWEDSSRSNDQSARAFREAGIVLAVGSWRAENDNPGDYELYYGEVDDLLAIRDHVAKLPYVDPERTYLAGHSSGGTLVLLAAEKSTQFRAAFSIGGDPLFSDPEIYDRYGGVPFNYNDKNEVLLRSAAPFYRSIKKPTFYFEGRSGNWGAAAWMNDRASRIKIPFQAFLLMKADHFSVLAPVTELIAKKILADTGPTTNIAFTQAELDALEIAH